MLPSGSIAPLRKRAPRPRASFKAGRTRLATGASNFHRVRSEMLAQQTF